MPVLKRKTLCDRICHKIGIVRRRPGFPELDKRELLHVNSALDLLTEEEKGKLGNEKED
jgi:hypothetical protein